MATGEYVRMKEISISISNCVTFKRHNHYQMIQSANQYVTQIDSSQNVAGFLSTPDIAISTDERQQMDGSV
jgi:hypothetical protein